MDVLSNENNLSQSTPAKFGDIQRQVAAHLRRLRFRKRLKQADLAKRLKLTQSLISRLETGLANPTLKTLEALARFFEVPIAYFFVSSVSLHVELEKDELAHTPVLPPGCIWEERHLNLGEVWEFDISEDKQILIEVRRGFVVISLRDDFTFLRPGKFIYVPGSNKVHIKGDANISIFHMPRFEGQYVKHHPRS